MAKNQTRRITPPKLSNNNDSFAALQQVTGYTPTNKNFSLATGTSLQKAQQQTRNAEAQATAALKTARDNATEAEWDFHNYLLGVKDQVAAQYGKDSNEFQAIGMKKKSEYKSPGKKKK